MARGVRAPGADEDQRASHLWVAPRPAQFVLVGIGLAREQVFIANVLKCRPPGNRDPKPDEVAPACVSGAADCTAAPELSWRWCGLRRRTCLPLKLRSARSRPRAGLRHGTVPLVVTYLRPYLRVLRRKAQAWEDLKFAPALPAARLRDRAPEILIRDMGFDDVAAVAELERQSLRFVSDAIFRDCLRAGYYCCVVELDHIHIGYGIRVPVPARRCIEPVWWPAFTGAADRQPAAGICWNLRRG